jgi:hypothetical protein
MSTSADPAGDAVLLALTEVIKGATSPQIQEAQAMLLRRLATQGDVIPSRIPAPLNITEVGGYFNLLTILQEMEMRREMLGAALGLATMPRVPAVALAPPMALTDLPNDRPAGPVGDTVPLSVGARADLADGVRRLQAGVHAGNGLVPLWSPAVVLPRGAAGAPPPDPLPWLGREVWLAPTAALVDPETDTFVLGRAAGDARPGFEVGIRVDPGTAGAATTDWTALVWDELGQAFVARQVEDVTALPLSVALEGTSFRARSLAVAPAGRGDYTWARLRSIAGLVPGVSRLGDELALLWPSDQIEASIFAEHLDRIWDGDEFA